MLIKKRCCILLLRITPARICFLRSILEAYDGLALLSTVDAGQGLVQVTYPPEHQNEVYKLLEALAPGLRNYQPHDLSA